MSKEGDPKFHKIDKDLSVVDHQLNCHCCELDDQEKTIRSLHEHQRQLEDKINNLMRVVDHLGVKVDVCNKTIRVHWVHSTLIFAFDSLKKMAKFLTYCHFLYGIKKKI